MADEDATASPKDAAVVAPQPEPPTRALSPAQSAIISELRRLAIEGTEPRARTLLPQHRKTVERVRRHFKSFSRARELAGLGAAEPSTPEEVLAELRALAELGVPINRSGLRSVGERQLLFLCCRHFRSPKRALAILEGGAPVRSAGSADDASSPSANGVARRARAARSREREVSTHARTAIVEELRGLAAQGVEPRAAALVADHRELLDRVRVRFKDLASARRAAGLKVKAARSPAAALAELRRLAEQGVSISERGLREVAEVQLLSRCRTYFGSIERAKLRLSPVAPTTPSAPGPVPRELGRPTRPHRASTEPRERRHRSRYSNVRTREDVIRALRAAAAPDGTIAAKPFRRAGGEMVIKRCYMLFGSFVAAREAAGLSAPVPPEARIMERDQIVAELKAMSARNGGFAPRHDALPIVLRRSIDAVFGGYAAARDAASVEARRGNLKWTREKIVSALKAWIDSGKPQTSTALARDRLDLWNAAIRHLGSITKAFALARRETPTDTRRRGRPIEISGARRAPGTRKVDLVREFERMFVRLQNALSSQARRTAVEIAAQVLAGVARTPAAARQLVESLGIELTGDAARDEGARAARRRQGSDPFLDPERARATLSTIVGKYKLSPRRADVLTALVAGVPRRHLGEALGLSEHSVKTHVRKMLRQLKQPDVAAAVWMVRSRTAGSPRRR